MRLIGVAIVRNEADIVEAFARTNLVLLDALHVMVHRSTDGTREILQALAGEGLPLRLSEIAEESFNQEYHVTKAARLAFRDERADFVFPLDADEFVRADSRAALEQSLASLAAEHVGALPWLTYVPTANDRPSELPLQRLDRRFRLSPVAALDLNYCKVVVGSWFAARADARILEGNHAVFARNEQLATARCPDVTVCHFPIRSAEQLWKKAALGWIAQLASGRDLESSGVSGHWRQIFRNLKDNGVLSEADMRSFVAAYVPPQSRHNELIVDPLPHRVDVQRYAAMQRPQSLVQALLERAESLARIAGASSRKPG